MSKSTENLQAAFAGEFDTDEPLFEFHLPRGLPFYTKLKGPSGWFEHLVDGAVAIDDECGTDHPAVAGLGSVFKPVVEGREGGTAYGVVDSYPGLLACGGKKLAIGESQRVVDFWCHAEAPFCYRRSAG